jgi:uncharacterized membrane protein
MSGLWMSRGPARPFAIALASIAVATLVGLIVLWPGDAQTELVPGLGAETELAEVSAVETVPCPGIGAPGALEGAECARATVDLRSGPDEGESTTIDLGSTDLAPDLDPGDEVRLIRNPVPPTTDGVTPDAAELQAYALSDFERRQPVLLLALAFALVVLLFARLRGALSLVGLGLSLAVVLVFIAPAMLEGTSPLAVAVVGSLAVMLLTISLAHGLGPKSLAAMLGAAASLVGVAILAVVFTDLAHLTGLASEEALLLQAGGAGLSLSNLLVAGMVIAALGVLDDVTVSQASTVLALRAANPGLSTRELRARALEVGRDHATATVNTLVLAYVGSSLPLLLILSSRELGLLDAVNLELVATELVAMLVGSIGLLAALPMTTAIAASLASRLDARDPAAADAAPSGHGH